MSARDDSSLEAFSTEPANHTKLQQQREFKAYKFYTVKRLWLRKTMTER